MQFVAPAEHYDRFMGRYATDLAPRFADAVGVASGMRALDVGCGPGAVTEELGERLGASCVAAIDPAPQFAAACRERNPGADVREGPAEKLPWDDGSFDVTMASLVIAFMSDADRGIREMARVTRPGGAVAACMWDLAGGGMTMLRVFWTAVRGIDPNVEGEEWRAGTAEGDIEEHLVRAGLEEVTGGSLVARADYSGFDDFWEPFTLAVGPAGQRLRSMPEEQQQMVREASRAELPKEGAFSLDARAWFAKGSVPH